MVSMKKIALLLLLITSNALGNYDILDIMFEGNIELFSTTIDEWESQKNHWNKKYCLKWADYIATTWEDLYQLNQHLPKEVINHLDQRRRDSAKIYFMLKELVGHEKQKNPCA